MASVIVEIYSGIFNRKVRAIGAVAEAVDHIDLRILERCSKSTCKSGTIVIGNEGGISNVDVISAVTTVPFQSVVGIVRNF